MANILRRYQNGNYTVTLLDDGTKIRFTEDDEFKPDFPENIDVKITDRCDAGCSFCYEDSKLSGKHARLFNIEETSENHLHIEPAQKWLKHLHPGMELAINGNDLSHPAINPFLPWLFIYLQKQGVIANLTVNQKHFMQNYDLLKHWCDNKLIRGLGVSLVRSDDELFIKRVQSIPNAVIHTIAGIFSAGDIECLKDKDLKLLILGYKDIGRGSNFKKNHNSAIELRKTCLSDCLPYMKDHFKVLSFDNLALEQLNVKEKLFKNKQEDWDTFYMGNDGDFTFYIDAVEKKYALNSCVPKEERKDIGDMNIDEMFKSLKDTL